MRRNLAVLALVAALGCGGSSEAERPDPCAGISCDDENPCTDDACAAGACTHTPNAAPCSDGNACTTGDTCAEGACRPGTATTCPAPPNAQCWEPPSCDPQLGCVNERKAEGTPCEDGNACTGGDACDATGACAPGPGTGCTPPGDADCYVATSCDPDAGCAFVPASPGTTCDDGNACTTGDACTDGVCAGTPFSCNDANPCTDDACTPAGGCVHVANTNSCDDGNACTTGDACTGGGCVGTAVTCDDGIACTADTCDAATGSCASAPIAAACDDENECTAEACGLSGCTYTPVANGSSCGQGTGRVCCDGLCADEC